VFSSLHCFSAILNFVFWLAKDVQATGLFVDAIVGLDLSLRSTGVAVITADGKAECTSFGHALKKDCGNYETIKRYISSTQKIISFLKPYKIEMIAIENYGFAGKSLAVQCEFGGIVKSQMYLAMRRVPIVLATGTIRKLLLGDAKAKDIKQRVMDKLIEIGYSGLKNFDESDALAVAHVARSLYASANLSKYERQVLSQLTSQTFRE
jgi:Holliday junction resolvasome RuvABC endonuclease subunit